MICRHIVASRLGYTGRNRLTKPLLVTRAFINPYKVLQVSEDADPSQIKRAYRKLALRHHPDINEEPSAEQDFLRIQEAYEILTHKREDSQANPNNNGWDFHDWYWDFTMSHRWDSHWKKHGRTGPSPFAATPSHRQQWQAQLSKLKQKAAYRRSQQQATHQSEHAGDQQHWSPRQQSEQPDEHTQTNQQHSREQQEEPSPERHLEGHQQAAHAEQLDSQPRHDHHDWLASHGCREDHYQAAAPEVHPAAAAVGHAPSYQYSQSKAVQQHADPSLMPTPSSKEHSVGDSPNIGAQAVEAESYLSSDQSSGVLAVLLTHQLLHHLQQHGHSLEWAVKQNSMMGAAMQHVQSPHSILHRNRHPDVAEDPPVDATADVITHSHIMPSHSEMPDPQEQASAQEQVSACITPGNSVPASDKGDVLADDQSNAAGPNGGATSFQTQHSQVQSQLAGLKRRAARKNAA